MEKTNVETEKIVQIVYQPQAVFRVRSVSRCTSSMPGILFMCLTFFRNSFFLL